ncbi:unnamed protein product [Rhizophagus irregularis]|nr:unnamed protein product [Rhizophagus irregularis]
MQRVFRGSAKVQRVFLWETGNANGLSENAKGSEVEFESLKRLGISGIRYTVSGYLDKGQRKVKIKSMGLDTGHETASGYFEFKMLMGFESGAWDN